MRNKQKKTEAVLSAEATVEHAAAPAKRRKLPLWAKILLSVVGIVLALAVLAALYLDGKLSLIRYDDGTIRFVGFIDKTEDQDLDGTGLTHTDEEMTVPDSGPFASSDVLNILLISTDERTEAVNDAAAFTHLNELDGTVDTTEFSENARADSLILVSLNIREDTIRLVSIERGTGVPIDLPQYEGEYDWITHTFRYGGARLTMDTVESCFGVQVDHYVRINFNSFVQIVDAVGGVDLDLTELEAKALNWEVPSNSMLIVNKVSPGLNHFDGYTALQYARLRKIDNDWQRVARQRTVIQAVLNQVKSASVLELDNLLNTVLPLVQTNFTKAEMTALLPQLPAFLGVDTEQMSLPAEGTYGVRTGMDGRLMYDPNWTVNRRVLQRFLYGTTSENDVKYYLRDNSAQLDYEAGLTAEAFGTGGYSLYLTGGSGTQTADYAAKKLLVQQLNKEQGANVLLEPCGIGAGLLLQQYLDTGRAETLEQYMQCLAGTVRFTNDEAAFWQWLYSYNAAQPQANRLRVAGIGPENRTNAVSAALAMQLKNERDIPQDLQSLAFLLQQQNPYGIDELRIALESDYYHTRTLFGSENWPMVKQLLADDARTQAYHAAAAEQQPTLQAAALLADFAFMREQYPDAVFFAQLDTAQILQADTDLAASNFAAQLCADADMAGKICTILPLYTDGERPNAALNALPLAEKTPLERLYAVALRRDSWIALDGPATPYAGENGFLAEGSTGADTPATALFQKIITLTATTPALRYGEVEEPETEPENESATPETAEFSTESGIESGTESGIESGTGINTATPPEP